MIQTRNIECFWIKGKMTLHGLFTYAEQQVLMFCKFCKEYSRLATTNSGQPAVFIYGSNNFRIEPIRSHNTSKPHNSCIVQFPHDAQKCLEKELLPKTTTTHTNDFSVGRATAKLGKSVV